MLTIRDLSKTYATGVKALRGVAWRLGVTWMCLSALLAGTSLGHTLLGTAADCLLDRPAP